MDTPAPSRLASVDILRGLTMAAMIVVNNPGSWSAMHPWLQHAPWGAWPRAADLIFPTFLFLVGVSVPLAFTRRLAAGAAPRELLHGALRRAGVLFVLGVGLNLYPEFDPGTLRIPGVLQRIAVVFAVSAAAFLGCGPRTLAATAAGLLLGSAALLHWAPVPGVGHPLLSPDTSLPVWLDDKLLGAHARHGPGDPEGLLSTLPALSHGLLGVLIGRRLAGGERRRPQVAAFAAAGAALVAAGALWSRGLPIAKEVWTASYALITAGFSLLALAACRALLDGRRPLPGSAPLALLGRRALTAFVAAHLLSDTAIRVLRWSDGAGGSTSLHHALKRILLDGWLPPAAASLTQSLLLLAAIVAGLAFAESRRADPRRFGEQSPP